MLLNQDYKSLRVEFTDIRFHRMTNCLLDAEITFIIMIQRGSGQFEITESGSVVATGTIKTLETFEFTRERPQTLLSHEINLDQNSFYYDLGVFGLQYGPAFRNVVEASVDGRKAKIRSTSNFCVFLDCMLQTELVGQVLRCPLVLKGIERVRINPSLHLQLIEKSDTLTLTAIKPSRALIAGGIEIQRTQKATVPRQKLQNSLLLENYTFVPHFGTKVWNQIDAIRIITQVMYEKSQLVKIKIGELQSAKPPIIQDFHKNYEATPLTVADLVLLTEREDYALPGVSCEGGTLKGHNNFNLMIAADLLTDSSQIKSVMRSLKNNSYLLSRESIDLDPRSKLLSENVKIICSLTTNQNETLHLLEVGKFEASISEKVIYIRSDDADYKWLENVKAADSSDALLLVAQERCSGLLGFMTCIRSERTRSHIRGVLVDDVTAPPFDISLPFYKSQLDLGMVMNVYKEVTKNL